MSKTKLTFNLKIKNQIYSLSFLFFSSINMLEVELSRRLEPTHMLTQSFCFFFLFLGNHCH